MFVMSLTEDLKKVHEKYAEEVSELLKIRGGLVAMTQDLSIIALISLVKTFNENMDELMQLRAADDSVIKFSESMQIAISDAMKKAAEISKAPVINNSISLDTKPLVSIANNIEKQNNSIIDLVKKLPVGDQAVLKEIVTMIVRNTEYINNAVTQVNYSEEIKQLSSAIQDRPRAWSVKVTERTPLGFWNEAILKEMNSAEEKKITSNKRL